MVNGGGGGVATGGMGVHGEVSWDACDADGWGKKDPGVRFVGLGSFVSRFLEHSIRGRIAVRGRRAGGGWAGGGLGGAAPYHGGHAAGGYLPREGGERVRGDGDAGRQEGERDWLPVRWDGARIADLFRKFHKIGLKLSGSVKGGIGAGGAGGLEGEAADAEKDALVSALGMLRSLQVCLGGSARWICGGSGRQ